MAVITSDSDLVTVLPY